MQLTWRGCKHLFLKLVPVVLVCLVAGLPASMPEGAAQTPQRPNIVFLLTDDQDVASIAQMRKLKYHLVDRGTKFRRSFVTTPMCCPSRATFLRGQYAHNHGVLSNGPETGVPGGWQQFRESGAESSTIATWLDDAGYATAYMGKYMNGYGSRDQPTTEIPPGWDRWWGWQGNYNAFGRCCYQINDNGTLKTYEREKVHDTDYLRMKANAFIRGRSEEPDPFFLVIAPNPPHTPHYPAQRHRDLFLDAKMPRPPSFNEAAVSDKPGWVQSLPLLDDQQVAQFEETWRQRQRALQVVDDLVGGVVNTLNRTGQLDETYVVYTSDNGYLLHKHRVMAKGAPYEEAIRVPLIVRGPGVPRGAQLGQMVANIDWAPTVAEWAGVQPPSFVDGRSFGPLLSASPPTSWRERLLIEYHQSHPFQGVRTSEGKTYVEYDSGERELYDLGADPYQLNNAYTTADAALLADLQAQLLALKGCAGEACRTAEDASDPQPQTP